MDMDELFEKDMDELLIWKLYLMRRKYEGTRQAGEAAGDTAAAEEAELAIANLPVVSAMEGLRANDRLASKLTAQRWIAVRGAESDGMSLEEIGAGLHAARRSATEFIQRKIAEQRG